MASTQLSCCLPSLTCVAHLVPTLVTSTVSQTTLEPGDGSEKVQLFSDVFDDNPSAMAVVDAVTHKLSLNRKQFLVAERIIQGVLSWKDYAYDRVKRELICIATEAGVGESQLIKTIVMAMTPLKREHEMMLLAPMEAAADNIGGNSIHNVLRMTNVSERNRMQSLWNRQTVDEVPMIETRTIAKPNDSASDTDCSEDAKYSLRLYNALIDKQDTNGMQTASALLQSPSRYTNCEEAPHVGICRLRRLYSSLGCTMVQMSRCLRRPEIS